MIVKFNAEKGPIHVVARLQASTRAIELTLALDTGADMTVINSALLREMGIDSRNSIAKIPLVTAGGIVVASKLIIPKLKALGITRNNFEIASYLMPRNIGCDGVLGLDFLRGYELNINFKTGHIQLK